MPSLAHLGRLFRTVAPLKVGQISNRIYRRLFRAKPCKPALLPVREYDDISFMPGHGGKILSNTEFCFLNRQETLVFPDGWNRQDLPILWLYNLHYFDGLTAPDTASGLKSQLVDRWIADNPAATGVGWQPYPLSLRIVNWVKWFLADGEPTKERLLSLQQQADFLFKTVEYHLLGNHLLENAKALAFAGCYFDGPQAEKWLGKALSILAHELDEQILDDGGHFELSPMYHSIMLELVLDLITLARSEKSPTTFRGLLPLLTDKAEKMATWLAAMLHPDGDISFFNDGSIGIAKAPSVLLAETARLTGWSHSNLQKSKHLKNSGYMRAENEAAVLFMDVAEVGPSYLPGHAHADTLSVELSLFGQRVITNVGTSEYGTGARRNLERSTPAHSTLSIGERDSSEMWAGFRVGRRARLVHAAMEQGSSETHLSGIHDGYRFLQSRPRHARAAILGENSLRIADTVSAGHGENIVRYHLHPDITLRCSEKGESGSLLLPSGQEVFWKAQASAVTVEEFLYAPSFGILQETVSLCLHSKGTDPIVFSLDWQNAEHTRH